MAFAPDTLIALRSLADIHQHRGDRGNRGAVGEPRIPDAAPEPRADPVLDQLESWLAAIIDDRAARAAS